MENIYIDTDSLSDTRHVKLSILTTECKQEGCCLKINKVGFRGNKKHANDAKCLLQIIFTSHTSYTSLFAYKQNFLLYFDAGLMHMALRTRGNGTNVECLR